MKENILSKYRIIYALSALGLIGASVVAMDNTAKLFDMLMPAVQVAHSFGGSIGWEWLVSGPSIAIGISVVLAVLNSIVLIRSARKIDLFANAIEVEPIS